MITNIDPTTYRGTIVDDPSDADAIARSIADNRIMVLSVLEAILDRYERNREYRFIDTKLSLLDGRDFDAADPVRGRERIYGWIQGRGLEALAGHAMWLERCEAVSDGLREQIIGRIRRAAAEVLESMEALRQSNNGRLQFVMTPDGVGLQMNDAGEMVPGPIDAEAPSNFSELFYAKGMAAAAHLLGDEDAMTTARQLYARVDFDIRSGRFRSDQMSLDPANAAIATVEGRHAHGPYMIGIGAAARFLQCTGDKAYRDMGAAYIDHILRHHVNVGGGGPSRRYDMWEFVDDDGRPYIEDGDVLRSDPGHACEFVGLAMKFLRICRQTDVLADFDDYRLTAYKGLLPDILRQSFATGFSPDGYGIAKAVDLKTRAAINADMPWWSLPEAMRAATEVAHVTTGDRQAAAAEIARTCSNAFARHFVRGDLHLMAYQTLDPDGRPVDVVPATPDADPGYHTGLSVIDCLDLWRRNP